MLNLIIGHSWDISRFARDLCCDLHVLCLTCAVTLHVTCMCCTLLFKEIQDGRHLFFTRLCQILKHFLAFFKILKHCEQSNKILSHISIM